MEKLDDISTSWIQEFLFLIPNRVINILISPGGRGKLARPPGYDGELDLSGIEVIPVVFIVGIMLYALVPDILRYILGHVAPTLLTLEASHKNEYVPEKGEITRGRNVSFRNVADSFRLIRAQGLYTLIRAGITGSIFVWASNTVSHKLKLFVFRHIMLKPLATACSYALLCELHLVFICATVSSQRPSIWSLLRRKSGQNRWKHLAIPALIYGLCVALMEYLHDFVAMALISEQEDKYTAMRAAAEVLAIMVMLSFRFFILLPTFITFTLAEAKFLPPEMETLIPSTAKERRLKAGEVIGENNLPVGLVGVLRDIIKQIGTPRYFWLIELHLKKCLVQIIFEFVYVVFLLLANAAYPHEEE